MDDPALLYAPHGAPGGFWNPWAPTTAGFSQLLRWKLLGRNPYAADKRRPVRVPVVENDGAYLASRSPGAEPPSVTWVGHSTFAIQDAGEVFLTDPHFGPRALLPARKSPPGLPLTAVPPHAAVLLSHNHYDHLDAWTVARLPPGLPWFVPLGLGSWLRRRGVAEVVELDWWASARHGPFTVTCLPAQHWSNRLDAGRNATLWCSWLLTGGERSYYFAGDSGYFHGFLEIGRRFGPSVGPIDAALLPIGAYEPRWFMRPQHMDPGEALRAFRDLGARRMIAMHWGAFDLTDEPVDLAPQVLSREVARAGEDPGRVHVPAVGERLAIS
jgi:N-acyl-phosphatidylethanolamine-hydrolysing phospholipase D